MGRKTMVAVVGASGATGSSVMHALLGSPGIFDVTALVRPASAGRDEFARFSEHGATVKLLNLSGPWDAVVHALTGMDVVISCLTLRARREEMTLVDAASTARVGRYVPSFFGPCCPPRGVMFLRDKKEDILDRIKSLYLPYTVIDFGWWYQLSLPPLPSGRIQSKIEYCTTQIVGDGNTPWALTDNRDIGRYVARIITDPRTLNKSVFGYSEVCTQNAVWDSLENLSGEAVPREHVSKEELLELISAAQMEIARPAPSPAMLLQLSMSQYRFSLGIRGDNTPERAKYLGYLNVRELYPDVEPTSLETYISDVLEGRTRPAYF